MFLVGLTVTFLGQMAAHRLMTRLKRRSIVVFSMATLMSLVRRVCYLGVDALGPALLVQTCTGHARLCHANVTRHGGQQWQ